MFVAKKCPKGATTKKKMPAFFLFGLLNSAQLIVESPADRVIERSLLREIG